jgi:glycosyltransferase involved in cell wall biosynthesis
LNKIAGNSNVFFHEKLSDEEMLALYQDSYLMLMPMGDSGANTAIVQALGVGLPIITTDNGGIRSYGGGDVFELVPDHDTQAMVQLFMKFYNDQGYRDEISHRQREFAVNELDWRLIAQKHLDVYHKIIGR